MPPFAELAAALEPAAAAAFSGICPVHSDPSFVTSDTRPNGRCVCGGQAIRQVRSLQASAVGRPQHEQIQPGFNLISNV